MTLRYRRGNRAAVLALVATACLGLLAPAGCSRGAGMPEPAWRIQLPGPLESLATGRLSQEMAFDCKRDGGWVLAVAKPGSSLQVLDMDMTHSELRGISPDGSTLWVQDLAGGELVFLKTDGEEAGRIGQIFETETVCVSDDLETILTYDFWEWVGVTLFNRSSGFQWELPQEPEPTFAALAPSGQCFAVGAGDLLTVYDNEARELWSTQLWHSASRIEREAWFSPDSSYLLVQDSSDIRLFEATGKPVWSHRVEEGRVFWAALSAGASCTILSVQSNEGDWVEALGPDGKTLWRRLERGAETCAEWAPPSSGAAGLVLLQAYDESKGEVRFSLCDGRGRKALNCRMQGTWFCGRFLDGGRLVALGAKGNPEVLVYRVPGE